MRKVILLNLIVLLMALSLWPTLLWAFEPSHSPLISSKDFGILSTAQSQILISEFMASNSSTLTDQYGDYSDWIEIYNSGSTVVNLEGWYLTDKSDQLTKWQFPDRTLGPSEYLLVFASDKERLGPELHADFKLKSNGEYLALVEPDGSTIAWEYSPQYPPQFEDLSYGLNEMLDERYFSQPTPGAPNGSGTADLGLLIRDISHSPALPTEGDNMTVKARIEDGIAPLASVTLHYRVMYSTTVSIPMFDDGAHDDGAAEDGIYGATIPASAFKPSQMVRYYITADDTNGTVSRWPLFHAHENSPEYLGTVISDGNITTVLSVLHWFVEDPKAAMTEEGTRASLFYNGTFYDNVFVRPRGRSAANLPKKSYKFDFNTGDYFHLLPHEEAVEEFNLNTTYLEYMRQVLAWETYRDAGVPYAIAFPMRVQQNGAFHSVAIFVEQPDERYLERQGLDGEGALYKMVWNAATSSTIGVEKKTRRDENNSDLQALMDGIQLSGQERTNYLFDHINLAAVINNLATGLIIQDWDSLHHNYYLYRDTNETEEWMILPWDKDHTFGRVKPANNEDLGHPFFGNAEHPATYNTTQRWNRLIDALYDSPVIREMYLRRLRTLMDQLLHPPQTAVTELYYEPRIDELFNQMASDVALDAAIWDPAQPFSEMVNSLKTNYLAVRRAHLYETHGALGSGLIPDAMPANPTIDFGHIEYDPSSGKQDEEYLTLLNPNNYAVDISGWRLGADIQITFQPGTVIPAAGTLYLSPNVVAFRSRASSPTGGEGHFVQGNYEGQLSNARGTLSLVDTARRVVARTTYGLPLSSLAGQLIVNELNYHPLDKGPIDEELFEFIELKNITPITLTIGGLHFTEAISYTFPATATLKANDILLLIADERAFSQRYPDITYAGIYDGKLSNGGEIITLVDDNGAVITSFGYDDQPLWPPHADGEGYTLVRHDPFGDPNNPCHWQVSNQLNGSPSTDEPSAQAACTESHLPLIMSNLR
ncbi:MAG: lamin tail domain-containing protein [Ardenticatenaceae bacterium]